MPPLLPLEQANDRHAMGAAPKAFRRIHLHGGAGGANQDRGLAPDAGLAAETAAVQEDQLT